MLHYKLQIGCLIIVLYICYIYLKNKFQTKDKFKWKLFDTIILFSIIYLIFDILTVYSVNHLDVVKGITNTLYHLVFLLSIDSIIFTFFLYMLKITGIITHQRKVVIISIWLPYIINAFILVTNIGNLEYRHGNYSNYSMGVSVYTCFAMIAIYEFFSIVIFLKRWKYIDKYKRSAISTFLLILILISSYQMIVPDSLISSVIVVIIILGIFINMEAPSHMELEQYKKELVFAYANIIESRDGSTGGHVKRTSKYVELIVNDLKLNGYFNQILTKDYIDNIVKAAPMHDIGKISIPDSILQKPGKLTDEEFDIMKKHTIYGAQLVRKSLSKLGDSQYIDIVYDTVLYHHEKWNGKGYPEGLKENEIPLCARIMAVADVFDAVVEKRCYREAMTLEQGFSIIEEGIGNSFDPVIAQSFLANKDKVIEIYNQFNEDNSTTL